MSKRTFPLHVVDSLAREPMALVAGGAGFLGSHLCEKLLTTCRVICLDNLRFGKRENIAKCLASQRFTFLEYDITKPIRDLLRRKVDYIFHVAGADDAVRAKEASLDTLLLNTYGTRNLLEKALSDKAKFLLVSTLEQGKSIGEHIDTAGARLFSESLTTEYIKKFGLDGRIIRLGHIFGPRMPLDLENPMSVIVKNLVGKKEVVLAADAFTRIYPVYIEDAIDVVVGSTFSGQTRGKIFNLIPAHSIALSELGKLLKEIDRECSFRFSEKGETVSLFAKEHFSGGTNVVLSPQKELSAQLKETVAFFQKNQPANTQQAPPKGFSFRFALMTFLVSFFLLGTVLPFLLLAAASMVGTIKLHSAYGHIREGNFQNASTDASSAYGFFTTSQDILKLLSYHFAMLGKQKDKEMLFLLLKSAEDASLSATHLSRSVTFLGDFFARSMKGGGGGQKQLLDQAIAQLNAAAAKMPLLEKELTEAEALPLPSTLGEYVAKQRTLLSEHRESIAIVQTVAGFLPDLLGFEDKRTYLILFQNNMELRPGGGFIGSYGLVTFEKGGLSSFEVFDVYQADGQLRGHVDPPPPIRKYLGQPNWFLRDSNWDPDFQNASWQATWFLEKEVGVAVHGVIALDVSFAKLLLETLGPISLPDYKETITADNVFERAQTYSEIDFFPGSTQKKDFLGALNRRIIDQLLADSHGQWLTVLTTIRRGIAEKHMLFSFNNPSIQHVFTLNNWGGAILASEDREGRFADFRMISEANLGVNKVNYYVARKINDEIFIGKEGTITGALTITYTNDSPKSWPGGTYSNYLRVLFPQDTKLSAIEIDGKEASISGKVKDFEVEEATQSGKSVFGFLLTVEPRASKTVTLVYELPRRFPIVPGSNTYAYVFQKQPGMLEDHLSVMINYPQALRIKSTNALVFQEKQVVTLSTNLAEDRLFTVEFLR